MEIAGKVFIVTGGASGLGEGTARMLVANGALVVLADLQEARGQALAVGRPLKCARAALQMRERLGLTPAERERFVEAVLEEAKGRAVVIGGASAASGMERVRLARQLVAAGCDGVLVSSPYETDGQYKAAVREVGLARARDAIDHAGDGDAVVGAAPAGAL